MSNNNSRHGKQTSGKRIDRKREKRYFFSRKEKNEYINSKRFDWIESSSPISPFDLISETKNSPARIIGTVISSVRDRSRILKDGVIFDAIIGNNILSGDSYPVTGDRVILSETPENQLIIREILLRDTVISRPDPQIPQRERAIAANVQTAVIVVSAGTPPLKEKLIDRYLVALERGGVNPVICLNKTDLADRNSIEKLLERLKVYEDLGIKVIPCSSLTGKGIDRLIEVLHGKTCVFIGHSGVGKSSILNAISPDLNLAVNSPRKSDGKGRHTTTASTLYRLPGEISVIDTPGIREFGLWKITGEDLRWYFPEFDEFAVKCKFRNCLHSSEPGCEVKSALKEGRISKRRYGSYLKLLNEVCQTAGIPSEDRQDGIEKPFKCVNCGAAIISGGGTEHRNHCPRCLWSVHLDNIPGDREAYCGGKMEPVSVWVRKGGEWAIIHRCTECGKFSSNRIASDDNEALLLSLAVKPISKPPFPLERLI